MTKIIQDDSVSPLLMGRIQCMRDVNGFLSERIEVLAGDYDFCCTSESSSSSSSSSTSSSSSSSSSSGDFIYCRSCENSTLTREQSLVGLQALSGARLAYVHPVSGIVGGSGIITSIPSGTSENPLVANTLEDSFYAISHADSIRIVQSGYAYQNQMAAVSDFVVGYVLKCASWQTTPIVSIQNTGWIAGNSRFQILQRASDITVRSENFTPVIITDIPYVLTTGLLINRWFTVVLSKTGTTYRILYKISSTANCPEQTVIKTFNSNLNLTPNNIFKFFQGGSFVQFDYFVRAFALSDNPLDFDQMVYNLTCVTCAEGILCDCEGCNQIDIILSYFGNPALMIGAISPTTNIQAIKVDPSSQANLASAFPTIDWCHYELQGVTYTDSTFNKSWIVMPKDGNSGLMQHVYRRSDNGNLAVPSAYDMTNECNAPEGIFANLYSLAFPNRVNSMTIECTN